MVSICSLPCFYLALPCYWAVGVPIYGGVMVIVIFMDPGPGGGDMCP